MLPQFREHYLATQRIQVTTYDDTWVRTFGKLPACEVLTPGNLMLVVLSTEAETSNRKLTCQRLQKLTDFAGVKIDVLQYQGHYGSVGDATPRAIAEDRLILEWRDRIPNKAWQWAYGMTLAMGYAPMKYFSANLRINDAHNPPLVTFRTQRVTSKRSGSWALLGFANE